MLPALLHAWFAIFDPVNFAAVVAGVLMGLVLGTIPGLGGIVGLTILIPFVYDLPPTPSILMLMALTAVTTTSDTIPAVLMGIPGTVAAQATILDGYPMAKRGEAARALGASFSASAIGGVIGAIVLFVSIPIVRPFVLQFRSPEFFMMALLGLSMVATLSRGATTKGLAAGGLGLLLTTIGQDSTTGVFRYVYGSDFLWEGLPIAAVALGLFALPEIVDLVIADALPTPPQVGSGKWQGVRDTLRNWFGVLRSSVVGIYIGLIPGLGPAVVDWIAYGIARQTSRNAETFGTGDVRGIIAVEAAANAREGGALITTLSLGIPGSVTMALLLTAFDIHGIAAGPTMLTKNLELTLTMGWGLVIANLVGTGICFLCVNQFARIARIKAQRLFSILISVVLLGAFQDRQAIGALIVVTVFGLLGWAMKRAGWPRPPLILGFILGAMLQNSLYLSIRRYGASWILDPIPLALAFLCLASIFLGSFYKSGRAAAKARWAPRPHWQLGNGVTLFFLAVAVFFVLGAQAFPHQAALFPEAIGLPMIAVLLVTLAQETLRLPAPGSAAALMDVTVDRSIPRRRLALGALEGFGWIFGLLLGITLFGFPAAIAIFVALYLKFRSHERWWVAGASSLAFLAILYLFFDRVLHIVWPDGLIALF